MVYELIRDLGHLRKVVARSDSDTLMAVRMREACGLGFMNAKPRQSKSKRELDVDEAEYWRMKRIEREMTGRIGALDRV